MLRKIYLHGYLGRRFGRVFTLDVASVSEAGRALSVLVPGFKLHVRERFYKVICGNSKRGIQIGNDEVDFRLGDGDIHITPVPRGAGRNGLGKILAGIFLIGAAFIFPGAIGALGGGIGLTAGRVAGIGFSMLLSGLGQMLAPKPKRNTEDDTSSYLFNNGPNTTTEGGAVPLVYGFGVRTTPVIIGVGISVEDIAI